MISCDRNCQKNQGFVLVATIWILAGLALIVAFIATQLGNLQQQSFAMEQDRVATLDSMAVESVTLYIAATRGTSYAGLRTNYYAAVAPEFDPFSADAYTATGDELRLDNRRYSVRNGHSIQLQDAGSLVSLRSDRLQPLRKLLNDYELSRSEVDRLVSTLTDYVDRDDVPLLNGAEKRDYRKAGMLPPTNRFLASPLQLYNVLGWERYLDSLPGLLDEITIYVADRENYNSMTPRGLGNLDEQDKSDVERILRYREDEAFTSLREVLRETGNVFQRDPFSVSFVPSRYLRMKITDPGNISEQWLGITLTPDSNQAPWQIDYRIAGTNTETKNVSDSRLLTEAPPTTLFQ